MGSQGGSRIRQQRRFFSWAIPSPLKDVARRSIQTLEHRGVVTPVLRQRLNMRSG